MSDSECYPTPSANVTSTCWSEPDVSQYICPSNTGQRGGEPTVNCLGATEIPLGVNRGCPDAPPGPSELAWDTRYTTAPAQGGGTQSRDPYYRKYKKMKAKYKAMCRF
jgi:hypothetical protein